jgi:TonB family protein
MRCSEPRPAPMRNFRVASSSSLQPRAHSDAVADFVLVRSMNPHRSLQRIFSVCALFAATLSCSAAAHAPVTRPRVATDQILEAPKPENPYEGQRRQPHGTGAFLLRTNIQSGRVTQVIVGQTTGNGLLDAAAVKALRQWRFKPGVLTHRDIHKPLLNPPISKEECLVLVPVTF